MAIFRNKTSQIQNNDENRQFCTSSYVETLCRKYFFQLTQNYLVRRTHTISLCQESSFLVRKRLGSDTWPISG